MRTTSFLARAILGVTLFQLALGTQLAAAQSAPSASNTPVPANSQTTVGQSANGTPVINIAAPNSAGVSHNFYNSYNVGSGGLILNNSAVNALSQLGGGTVANPNLANHASASLILNEVIAPNSGSILAGYQEILGPSAELVIANPWGITCNGCGFLNTPRVTLTTGAPTLDARGALAGFTITGGQIAIGANGLDATRQNVLDLLARSISVAGNIQVGNQSQSVAGDLQLIGGASQFDYASRTATPIAGSGAAPQFAIDSSALGGMYANRIRLLVTEQGAGVRLLGGVAALADDLTISATGDIELRGAVSAANDLDVNGGDINIQLADSNTDVFAGHDLNMTASGILGLGTGSVGSQRNVSFVAASLVDNGGSGDLRFSGNDGTLQVTTTGAFSASGGYWQSPSLSVNAGSIALGVNATLYGSGASGDVVQLTTPGDLTINGGKVYSNADATLSAQRIQLDSNAVVASNDALNATATSSGADGVDSAGTLQGDTITLNSNDVVNSGVVKATTSLTVNSSSLENDGANAVIEGSTSATGTAQINVATVTNSGTIWSAGDLNLSPTSLVQQRDPAATANPLIGAGRDLTLAFTGAAALGTGDLQAGRNLTITGTSITDLGATSSTNSSGDLRYAGGNLSATAAPGGLIDIAGGTWFSTGDLRLTGDNITIGSYVNQGAQVFVPGVTLWGAQGGSGTVALTSRTGGLQVEGNDAVFSGADLTVTQPNGLTVAPTSQLEANGSLSVAAGGFIQNFGTLAGGNVALASSSSTPLVYRNESTGVLWGQDSVQIGTTAAPADSIVVTAPQSGTNAGIFGGVLNIQAGTLTNDGVIQAVGGGVAGMGSLFSVTNFYNNGTVSGFADGTGGGITIAANSLNNSGLVYDSTDLQLNIPNIENQAAGVLGSAGRLQIQTQTAGATSSVLDNQGQIWASDLTLLLGAGLQNGRDAGSAGYTPVPGSIYAANSGLIIASNGSDITNNGSISTGGDLTISGTGGTFSNVLSKIPSADIGVQISTINPIGTPNTGDLGLLMVDPTTGIAATKLDFAYTPINGVTNFYTFNVPGGSQYAYSDSATFYSAAQYLQNPVPMPSVTAGGNLTISNFQNVTNTAGTLSAVGNLTITSSLPGATLTNTSLPLDSGELLQGNSVTQYVCVSGTGSAVSCQAPIPGIHLVATGNTITVPDPFFEDAGFAASTVPGVISAGGTTTVNVQTVANIGNQASFTAQNYTGPAQTAVSVTAPGNTPNVRNGAGILNIGGTRIPLPTSGNGQFITNPSPGTGPLIETNPLFGIDSAALGSAYLVNALGLNPDQQARDVGDNNYENYLIQQQVLAATDQAVLQGYGSSDDMISALFTDAASQAKTLKLTYGTALTPDQIAGLTSDIVWMVQTQVQGQTVLVPVVYLTKVSQATMPADSTITGGNLSINAANVTNLGGNLTAQNNLSINTTGNISNLSGNISAWNVQLSAGGDVINSTLLKRIGDAQNGTDMAEQTGTIQAGNIAYLNAGHDVNVIGAAVSAGQDAVLIAQHNVNVKAVALTTNYNGTGADGLTHTGQTQTALGSGVTSGGDLAIQATNDVNLAGASVGASGTTYLNAQKGNVNVGALALQNTDTSSSTQTGTYTQFDTDKPNAAVTLGAGVQHITTTNTTTTTTGMGSAVAGNSVVIATGAGDVNINGSGIAAGNGGAVIDSARDVNITAFNNQTTNTNSTSTVRAGVELDASADGVFGGLQQSGTNTTTTTTQTTAQVSSINSRGGVTISGQGNVTNEGTDINAGGDVVLAGQNVINKAAQDTFTTSTTTSTWQTKEQEGLTTNGTGASINNVVQGTGSQVDVNNLEYEQRLTGSYNTDTNGNSLSQAQGTQITAGGSVTVYAKNNASDQATQYSAGKDIDISAESYTNKAAANTNSTTQDSTYGSGTLTAGLTSSVEVALSAAANGGHQTSGNTQSTAQVGTMKAGGNVNIDARSGDVTLEGTQIGGASGVTLSAAKNVNINQANNTNSTTSSEQSGDANVSASVSLVGAGGSVGVGADTRLANSNNTTSTAQAASITSGSGSIKVQAGNDLNSQGANMNAGGDISLAAGHDVNLMAATDHVDKTGSVTAGGANVNVGFGADAEKSVNGGTSVNFENGQTDYHEANQHGSTINAGGGFSVTAGNNATLQGAQVNASTANFQTGGNLTLESAQHTIKDNSHDVSGTLDASFSKGGGSAGASTVGSGSSGMSGAKGGNSAGGDAGVNVVLSQQDIATNTNASINTRGTTTVNVGGDMTLQDANINAKGGTQGSVAGNLTVETVADKTKVDQSNVSAYAGMAPVGGAPEGTGAQKAQAGLQTGANIVAQSGAYTNVDTTHKDDTSIGTASGISGGGINVTVGGNTTLTGATNNASDFKTAGTTTVQSVQTHQNDSSTQFQFDGTVASAAGSGQGKGGSYGLNVYTPNSHSSTPEAEPTEPTTHGPAPAEPIENVPGPHQSAPVEPPSEHEALYANSPLGHESAPYGNFPVEHEPAPSVPHESPAPVVHEPAPVAHEPAPVTPYASAHEPVPVEHEPAPSVPHENPAPVVHEPVPVAPYASAREPAPQHLAEAPAPVNHSTGAETSYQDDNTRQSPPPDVAPPARPVVADNGVAAPNTAAPKRRPMKFVNPLDTAPKPTVRQVIDSDPRAQHLAQEGADLDPQERVPFERNLAEIIAFTNLPGKAALRPSLLDATERSLVGPQDANGVTLFPLHVQYVGEDVDGFANWRTRFPSESPGDAYQGPSRPVVRYLTPEEQQERQVTVNENGELTYGNHQPLADGQWIFVVNENGEMIVDRQVPGRFHHSSLAGGDPVRMAGELTIGDGKIISISNSSGHYRPSMTAYKQFIGELSSRNDALHDTLVKGYDIGPGANGAFEAKEVDSHSILNDPAVAAAKSGPARILAADEHAPLPQAQAAQGDAYFVEDDEDPYYQDPSHGTRSSPAVVNADAHSHGLLDPAAVTAAKSATRQVIDSNPRALQIDAKGTGLDPQQHAAFESELAEIIEFTNIPANATRRTALLNDVEDSLRGPRPGENDVPEYPLGPQYVGEDVQGFNNWFYRRADESPGSKYGKNNLFEPVHYLTTQEQQQHRVVVTPEGKLTFNDGTELHGDYIFVVNQRGELIAGEQQKGTFHHSSLAAGKPVRVAGAMTVDNGTITYIDNQSGHYRPPVSAFKQFAGELAARNGALAGAQKVAALSFAQKGEGGNFELKEEDDRVLSDPAVIAAGSGISRILTDKKPPAAYPSASRPRLLAVPTVLPGAAQQASPPSHAGDTSANDPEFLGFRWLDIVNDRRAA